MTVTSYAIKIWLKPTPNSLTSQVKKGIKIQVYFNNYIDKT